MTFVSRNDRKLLAICFEDKNKSEIKYTMQQPQISSNGVAKNSHIIARRARKEKKESMNIYDEESERLRVEKNGREWEKNR